MEPATWHLNLLHIRLARQWDDGLELGGTDSSHSHRLHWFNVLKLFRYNRREALSPNGRRINQHVLNLKTSRHVLKDLQLAASLLQPYNLNVNPVILTQCRVLRLT